MTVSLPCKNRRHSPPKCTSFNRFVKGQSQKRHDHRVLVSRAAPYYRIRCNRLLRHERIPVDACRYQLVNRPDWERACPPKYGVGCRHYQRACIVFNLRNDRGLTCKILLARLIRWLILRCEFAHAQSVQHLHPPSFPENKSLSRGTPRRTVSLHACIS